MANYRKAPLAETVRVARALGDPHRLRALLVLRGRELCVCQLTELLELAPSTVSKHLSLLRQAGLVELRKEGRWAWLRLADGDVPPAVQQALAWIEQSAAQSPEARADQMRLQRILKINPEELCRRQCGNEPCES